MKNKSKVLALKYRPQVFKDLIGQEIIAETIYNSIKHQRSPNAFLFTGIRGVGKTTFARIVAKSLNCENGIDNLCEDDFCQHCDSIINSNHIDVLEMDAASKTGVDDVRDLIEFSRYGPTSAKYKIFIIDEVHMLSKQAFNALLKTLEEPPEYLKFIFATTEIKKIPITVVSRCQRFDLSRVKSSQLFDFLKKICTLENGKITDDALKLIVKISEGSVRDSLSLLDRGLMSNIDGKTLDLDTAHQIYGYFDKSYLIQLFDELFKGEEQQVTKIYRKLYDTGVEPKSFLNDFLEVLYYIKNISTIKLEGTNFSLNDEEFNKIKYLSEQVDSNDLILFWQFTIKTMNELDMVSNQNISIEMFLIRLMYLKDVRKNSDNSKNGLRQDIKQDDIKKKINISKTVDQIKNINQKEKPKAELNINDEDKVKLTNFSELIQLCHDKKEIKLKYELETNVNLVSFAEGRIEIGFNENLDKDFIKELSNKLFEWTNLRWMISLSKKEGEISIKQREKINKEKIFEDVKKSETYRKILEALPDAKLIDVETIKEKKND